MANVVAGTTELETTIKNLKDESVQYMMYTAGTVMFSFALNILFDVFFLMNLLWFIAALMAYKVHTNIQQIKVYSSGLKGEQETLGFLASLPASYTVFSDVNVSFEEKTSQLDHVIIGPTGVFVVETKNWNGVIEGSDKDKDIVQYKTGRNGGKYSAEHYNPVRQITTHVCRLSGFLKEHGVRTWVHSLVFFSNPEVTVNLTTNKAKIFTVNEMENQTFRRYITENKETLLTLEEQNRIIEVLKKGE